MSLSREPAARPLRERHPAVTRGTESRAAQPEAKREALAESKAESKAESSGAPRPDGKAVPAAGPLVRSVGGFIVSPEARFEEDNDVLTALVESIQRSGQQQPDSAAPSSGEVTPQARPVTPQPPEPPDPPHRLQRSRLPSRGKPE